MMKIRTIPGEFSGVNVRPAYHSLSFSRYTPRSPFATLSHTRSAARFSESSEHDEHSPLLEMEQRSRLNRKRRTRCDGPKAKGAASHGSVKAIFHRFNEVEIFWPLSPHPRTPLLTSPFSSEILYLRIFLRARDTYLLTDRVVPSLRNLKNLDLNRRLPSNCNHFDCKFHDLNYNATFIFNAYRQVSSWVKFI